MAGGPRCALALALAACALANWAPQRLAAEDGGDRPADRSSEAAERLDELEEDGVVLVRGRTPEQVLQGLLTAALAQNLTNPRAVEMMNRNVEKGRSSVEKYVDTWSMALSKALDRAQNRRKERRKERRAEKEREKVQCPRSPALFSPPHHTHTHTLRRPSAASRRNLSAREWTDSPVRWSSLILSQEEKRAAKAAERQEELRQASIAQPLSASGIKMPPDRPYVHDGHEVLAAVRTGDVQKLLLLCNDDATQSVAPGASSTGEIAAETVAGGSSRQQTNADVDFIPTGDDADAAVTAAGSGDGGPAIHLAIARGDSAMVSALLSKSCAAEVDLFNPRTGYTPLHLATAHDNPAIMSLLIEVSLLIPTK
eukprot:COSAG06_NODE_7979_length_2306_cov_1.014453_1_plen_369_part_00